MARWIVDPSISTFPDASGIVFSSVSCNIIRSKGGAFFSTQLGGARATEPDYLTLPTPGVDYPFTLTMETPRNAFTRRLRFASVIRGNQTFGTPLINLVDPPDDTPRFIAESGAPRENALNNFAKKKRTIWDIARNKNSFSMFPASIPATQFSTISCDLFSEIQRHLLENTIDGGLTWSDLWTKSEVQGYFNERLSKFYLSTGVIQKSLSVPVIAGASEYDYPSDLIQAKRLTFEENLSLYTGLVSFWRLNEAQGASRLDSIGSNHLTPVNAVTQEVGKVANAAGFLKASSTRLGITDASQNGLNPGTGNFSLSFWIYSTEQVPGVQYCIIGKGATGSAPFSAGYSINLNMAGIASQQGVLFVVVGDNSSSFPFCQFHPSYQVPLNTWTHFTLVFNRTGNVECYANGVKYFSLVDGSSDNMNFFGTNTGPITPNADFVLGQFSQNNGGGFVNGFSGRIDAVGYWSRSLTQAEALTLYNGGNGRELFLNAHDGPYVALPRQDPFSQDNGDPGWQSEVGTPSIIIEEPRTPLSFQLSPTPSLAGSVEGIYVADPTAVGDACVPLPIPNFMTWGIKYGVMADMLNKEGEANDPERAKYCEARWDECIQLTRLLLGFNDQEGEEGK